MHNVIYPGGTSSDGFSYLPFGRRSKLLREKFFHRRNTRSNSAVCQPCPIKARRMTFRTPPRNRHSNITSLVPNPSNRRTGRMSLGGIWNPRPVVRVEVWSGSGCSKRNPQPCLDPTHTSMARWPKTSGELKRYIGAESVRTIRQERELCFWCAQRVHL